MLKSQIGVVTKYYYEGNMRRKAYVILFRHQKEIDDSVSTQLFTFSCFHKLKKYSRAS